MIPLMLSEVVAAIRGKPCGEVATVSVRGVSTDSRTVQPGELFFALRGPRFDGHEFVAEALGRGAAAAVVAASQAAVLLQRLRQAESAFRPATASCPCWPGMLIAVGDPLEALGRLAAACRRRLSASVIAVVGSNGKTTTKAMLHHILAHRFRGRASPNSFNNQVGVPLTLLSAEPSDEYLVAEIGTNRPGEIGELADLVRPELAVLTSLSEEHLEGLGDLEGVAREEFDLFARMQPGGFAAVNLDSPLVRQRLPLDGIRVVTFGWNSEADVRLTAARLGWPWLHFSLNGRFHYRLRLAGTHNAVNAAGAVVLARRLGMDHEEIAGRLETFAPLPMRNEVIELDGLTIINDAYNANPASVAAALSVLESLPSRGRRIVVLGEMCELGAQSKPLHHRVGQLLLARGFDCVFLVGSAAELMREVLASAGPDAPRVYPCEDVATCQQALLAELRDGDVVLLKASRAVGLERLVEPLRQRWTACADV